MLASTSGKDTGTWGAGTDFSDLTALQFAGFGTIPTVLATTSTTGVENVTLGARLNPTGSTPVGSYSGQMDVIAVANP